MPTLYRNGRIYAPGVAAATAILIEDGVIGWVGADDGAAAGPSTQIVDLDGALVTPAFVDAHLHATSTGLALTGLDLSTVASLAAVLDAVEAAARAGRGRPVLGFGWDETNWPEHRPPSAPELDRAGYGGLVYLSRVDAHAAVVSSALAAAVPGLAGLAGYRRDGWLTSAAHDAARELAFASLTPTAIRHAQRAALRYAASMGIGCVHEMAGPITSSADDLAGLLTLAAEEPLPEVIGYWGELFGVETARALGAAGAAGDLYCDGSLGSHTAALHAPYADRPETSGELCHDAEAIAEHVLRCVEAGLQAGFHAIGEAAVDQVMDGFELASARLGRAAGAGHRVEHVEMVRDPERLARSGLVASMQPMFDAAWGGAAGMYAERLGVARAASLNRFAELAAAGVPLAFGSDSPVTQVGPWAAVQAAAYPHEEAAGIAPRAAFTAHTRGGWRAAGRDGEGVLVPGAPASFAVWEAGELQVTAPDERVARWSTDPRAAVAGLPDLTPGKPLPVCRRTLVRGATVFQAD